MLRFDLNGRPVEVEGISPTTTLLQWLRAQRSTGTKEGCAEGDCGACTVAVRDPSAPGGWRAVNSCLVLLPMVAGREVVTVEGLGRDVPHPVQTALVEALGSQCGYCTPGFTMALFEACHRPDLAGQPWKLDDQICGNLCRCTGYRPIRDALRAVAGTCPADGVGVPEGTGVPPAGSSDTSYDAGGQRFFAPSTVSGAVDVLAREPGVRVICGATDLGLDVTQRHVAFPALLSVERIDALRGVGEDRGRITIGAATPLTDLEAWSADGLPVLHRMLRYFGSRQIKHRATIGGNLCNASPIGDLAPVLLALDAELVAVGPQGERRIPIDAFFVAYRKTALQPGELLARIELVRPSAQTRLGAYKVSRRRELDISAVAAGMRVEVDGGGVVTLARLAYGGMAATPKRSAAAEAALVGRPWTEETVRTAAAALEFQPLDDHRGSAAFRRVLARNLLIGFYEETRDRPFVPLTERHAGTLILGGGP